jgi:hypothetical protein
MLTLLPGNLVCYAPALAACSFANSSDAMVANGVP